MIILIIRLLLRKGHYIKHIKKEQLQITKTYMIPMKRAKWTQKSKKIPTIVVQVVHHAAQVTIRVVPVPVNDILRSSSNKRRRKGKNKINRNNQMLILSKLFNLLQTKFMMVPTSRRKNKITKTKKQKLQYEGNLLRKRLSNLKKEIKHFLNHGQKVTGE